MLKLLENIIESIPEILVNTLSVICCIFAPVTLVISVVLWVLGRIVFLLLYFLTKLLGWVNGAMYGKYIAVPVGAFLGLTIICYDQMGKPFAYKEYFQFIFKDPLWWLSLFLLLISVAFAATFNLYFTKAGGRIMYILSRVFYVLATRAYVLDAINFIQEGAHILVTIFKGKDKTVTVSSSRECIVKECRESLMFEDMMTPCVETITLSSPETLRYLTPSEKYEATVINAWKKHMDKSSGQSEL